MKNLTVFSILFIALLSGCATVDRSRQQLLLTVDSLSSSIPDSRKTYLLLPGNDGVTKHDLLFKEFAAHLTRALNSEGFIQAKSSEDADLLVFLSYGVGDPRTHLYSYSFPTWGRTGTAAYTSVIETSDGMKRVVTSYRPIYEYTGYETHLRSRTTFSFFAAITAYDYEIFKKTEEEIQLWKTTVSGTGLSDDLRRIFPILIEASKPYLATDTGGKIQISPSETNKIIKAFENYYD